MLVCMQVASKFAQVNANRFDDAALKTACPEM
jgi:hypothetical protein